MNQSRVSLARFTFILLFQLVVIAGVFTQTGDDGYELRVLISGIKSVGAPYIKGNYMVFTANGDPRHVGIAFDFENFRSVHSMERIETTDFDYKVTGSFLFYVLAIPKYIDSVSYKLVIDGMWITDPLNPNTAYDKTAGLLSNVRIPPPAVPVTAKTASGTTRFAYHGEPGQRIRLTGTFTAWDPYIYTLTETSPGIYELEIPLPRGTYYYKFLRGLTEIIDESNSARVFSSEGLSASVLQVD
jgi:hypothetical protein